jgi:hypothetical protein
MENMENMANITNIIQDDFVYKNIKDEMNKINLRLINRYKTLNSINESSKCILDKYNSYFETQINEKKMAIQNLKNILEYLENLKKKKEFRKSKNVKYHINNDINKIKLEIYKITIELIILKNTITT